MMLPIRQIKDFGYMKGFEKITKIYMKGKNCAKAVADSIHKGEIPNPKEVKEFKKFFYRHREKKEKELNDRIIEMLVRWESGKYDKDDAVIIIYEWLEALAKGEIEDIKGLDRIFKKIPG